MEKQEIIKNWIMNIADNDDIISIINQVDSYTGNLSNFHYYFMEELNDLFCDVKPLDLLDMLAKDFDSTQELFQESVYGLESCSMVDAIEEIKSYIDEISETIAETIEKYDDMLIPLSLEEELEEE